MKEKVLVLISTFNGEKYIEEQIKTILNQQNIDCDILIRDDGSTDGTKGLLRSLCGKHKNISWYQGNNIGCTFSFLDLIFKSNKYDYYALCDQDDFWLPTKIFQGLSMIKKTLKKTNHDVPILYFGTATVTNSNLEPIKQNKRAKCVPRKMSDIFAIGHMSGCTFIFNHNLKQIICSTQIMDKRIYIHDFYIGAICLACGGKIVYDKHVPMFYRQHEKNVIGAGKSFGSVFKKTMNENAPKNVKSNLFLFISDYFDFYLCNRFRKKIRLIRNYSENRPFSKIKLAFSSCSMTRHPIYNIKFIYEVIVGRY